MDKYILIKQIRSSIKQSRKNKLFIKSLGIKKINHKIFVKNSKSTRSLMIKLQHLIFINKKNI